jgi:DNA adenine methylase
MKSSSDIKKLRPVKRTHGGKYYMAHRINPILQAVPHTIFLEDYGGGASVLLNKAPVQSETYNELDPRAFNLMRVIRESHKALLFFLDRFEYGEEAFGMAKASDEAWKPGEVPLGKMSEWESVTAAGWYLIRNRMSRGGYGESYGWSDRLRGGVPEYINAWRTTKDQIQRVSARLENVQMWHLPAGMAFGMVSDQPHVLVYRDPPYKHSTRTAKDSYGPFEMSDEDHVEFLKQSVGANCRVAISGYRSELYDDHLKGWTRHQWNMANHTSQKKAKARRVECLWTNW